MRRHVRGWCLGAVLVVLLSGCQSDGGDRQPVTTRQPPTPSPSVSASPSAPAERAWPGPGNTGVPEGVRLRKSGSLRVTKNGTVIDGLEVTGYITVEADDVTIRNTRVRGTKGWWGSSSARGVPG
ncbi:hypothetical protein ACFQYP_47700 [Nonomuraea antimicrobica]